jgi:cyanobactin biosynthesis protein (PatB/AcyB/McaB family)
MNLPLLSLPVQRDKMRDETRNEALVMPFDTVDLRHGTPGQLLDTLLDLVHGANYNDPPRFITWSYDRLKSSFSSVEGSRW